jgi:NAD(P)-dependent dehydrogenase (short-subunit alcohol dehydrogenase family)
MHEMNRLSGKTAVITGGATGIGRAAAKRFIEEGAFVFIFGRRQKELDAAVADLGPNARAVKGSVSDEADLDRLYAAVKAERKTLDIVFANAGVGSQLRLGEITAKHIDETFDVNVKGTIFTVQKALPLMGKGGSIILTGSSAGTTGAPAFTAYSASKAAVRNLARTWAEDLKGTGIRVNVLSPGATATEHMSYAIIGFGNIGQALAKAFARSGIKVSEVMQKYFAAPDVAEVTAMRNGTLQGAYLIVAARALGLDCGPMSGFDNAGVDKVFFSGTRIQSNFICSIGYGDPASVFPRNPRLNFEEAGRWA